MKRCPKCNGSGHVIDDEELGKTYRAKRLRYKVKLREVSALTGYSIGFISDLESGRRKWSGTKELEINTALNTFIK